MDKNDPPSHIDAFTEEEEDLAPPDIGPLSNPATFATLVFLLICIVVCVIFWRTTQRDLIWVSNHSILVDREYWRLLTAIFAPADLAHFLSNSIYIFVFGWFLFTSFGWFGFPIPMLCIGAIANYFTVLEYQDQVRLVGASGVVFAMIGSWVTFMMNFDRRYSFGIRLVRAVGVCLLLLIPSQYRPETSYLAHAIGFGLGVAYAMVYLICRKVLKPVVD